MFVEARFAVDDTSFLCNDGTAADFETRLTVSVIHQVKTDKPLQLLLFLFHFMLFFNHLSVKKWCRKEVLDKNVMMM